MIGALPLAPAAPGVADGGRGGQLPGLRDDIGGLASEGRGGAVVVSRDRGLVVAVLSHVPVQRAGEHGSPLAGSSATGGPR